MRRWDNLLEKFIQTLETRGLSKGFVEHNFRELQRFGNWLKRRKPCPELSKVDYSHVVAYLKSRSRFKAKSTICAVLTALKGMGNFLVDEKAWNVNPVKWLKGPKVEPRAKIPRRITQNSMEALLQQGAQSHVHYYRYLWCALLAVLYSTGLRRGELERLDLSDWNSQESTLQIDGRKTGVERVIPLGEAAWRCLEAYLPYRQIALEKSCCLDEPALFLNKHGKRLSGSGIGVALLKLAKKAEVPLVTLHQFRHTCASDLLESGIKLPMVQRFLGHACYQSTIRYLAISEPARWEAMKLHPINEILSSTGGNP